MVKGYEEAMKAKILYNLGKITREEARAMIEPYASAFNEKSKELAKKYNVKAKLFNFNNFLR